MKIFKMRSNIGVFTVCCAGLWGCGSQDSGTDQQAASEPEGFGEPASAPTPDGGLAQVLSEQASAQILAAQCQANTTSCSGKCVDLRSDNRNCGGCGLTCSSSCTAGRCVVTLAAFQNYPDSIVVNDKTSSVYWVNFGSQPQLIRKVARSGGSVQTLETADDDVTVQIESLAVDGSFVYWGTGFNGKVYKVPVNGGSRTLLATGDPNQSHAVYGVAVDSSSVYWSDWVNGKINKAPLNGSKPAGTLLASLGSSSYPNQVAIDSQNVYWFGYSGAQRVSISGGVVQTLGASGYDLSQDEDVYDSIAVDSTYAYWASGEAGTITRARKSDGARTTLAANQSSPYGLAVDATSVYWTTSDGSVKKTPLGGGTITTIVQGLPGVARVAVDGTSVYWTTYADGRVMKATPK